MRIFYGFLIIFAAAMLFLLPITEGVYDFRTDLKEDYFRLETDGATTTANLTLLKAVYDGDTNTISVLSNDSDDIPVVDGYTSSTRLLDITGLAVSTNRTLTVTYDIDALSALTAISNLMDQLSWLWLIMTIGFAPAALVSMWMNKGG